MKSLTKTERQRLDAASAELDALFQELEVEREAFTGSMQRIIEKIAEQREEAHGILEDAADAADVYFDERSEKWQEGDTGQHYAEWRDRLRELADGADEDIEPLEVAEIETPQWVDDIRQSGDFAEFEGGSF
jgi:hypothetical protein